MRNLLVFNNLLRIVLTIFAVYRVASLISSEEGPYVGWPIRSDQQIGIFEAIRLKLGAYSYNENGKPETNLGRGISCPLCTGFYFSLVALVFVASPTLVGDLFILWLGISGIQIFLVNFTRN